VLEALHIPCNPDCDWKRAISEGEDYELCFTATGEVPQRVADVSITKIGEVVPRDSNDSRLVVMEVAGRTIDAGTMGWEHGDR
jgi:thiamine monophosphate kinase